ncbi:MAG TPA: hypothetical protein VKU44_09720 [Terriglobia bacterium]|nr:hypothetical protein [Terriglobia bacterium]
MPGSLSSRTGWQATPPAGRQRGAKSSVHMVPPINAWRILNARTGGAISRATFYRWLSSGTIYSVRVGHRFYIPWPVLEEIIEKCRAGDRIGRG